jgi:hypothetical protein
VDHAEELLGLLGALAAEGVVDPVGRQQLVEGVQVPGVDDLLVEPPRACLLSSTGMAPSFAQVPGLPDSDCADHSRGALAGLSLSVA